MDLKITQLKRQTIRLRFHVNLPGCKTTSEHDFPFATLPKLNSLPLKNDVWKRILSFWGLVTFQGLLLLNFRLVSLSSGSVFLQPTIGFLGWIGGYIGLIMNHMYGLLTYIG